MNPLIALFVAGVLFADHGKAESTNNGTMSSPKEAPVAGMTREKVKSYYGAPFTQMALSGGERWYYRLKFDEVYGRAFVPFYYDSANVRWGSIDFGPDGRVKAFDWRRGVSH